jgi:hypothetical protein
MNVQSSNQYQEATFSHILDRIRDDKLRLSQKSEIAIVDICGMDLISHSSFDI